MAATCVSRREAPHCAKGKFGRDRLLFGWAVWKNVQLHWKQLESIEYGGHHQMLQQLSDPLVRKISVFFGPTFSGAVDLFEKHAFRPTRIELRNKDLIPDPETAFFVWEAMCALDSLEEITIWSMIPRALQLGFPPNLKHLRLVDAWASAPSQVLGPDARKAIKEKRPPSLETFEIDFVIPEPPQRGTNAYESLVEELLFWDSLNDPGFWLRVNPLEGSGEEERFRCRSLEMELWEWSPRVDRF